LRICKRFFTQLLIVLIFGRSQIFIQLSPILTKLCHIKRDYPVARITYTVLVDTLNPAQSINQLPSSHNMRKMSKTRHNPRVQKFV